MHELIAAVTRLANELADYYHSKNTGLVQPALVAPAAPRKAKAPAAAAKTEPQGEKPDAGDQNLTPAPENTAKMTDAQWAKIQEQVKAVVKLVPGGQKTAMDLMKNKYKVEKLQFLVGDAPAAWIAEMDALLASVAK